MITKSLRNILVALLLAALTVGCSGKTDAPGTDAGSTAVTSGAEAGSAGSDNSGETPGVTNSDAAAITDNAGGNTDSSGDTHGTEDPEKVAEIKKAYTPSAEDAAVLAEENTEKPIIYSGFTYHYFPTPAKSDDVPVVSATPLFSHSGLHNYLEQNAEFYDFGEGDGSFEAFAEGYMDSFFADKGVMVISFTDSEGGSGYTLTGAWEDHIHIDEMHLDQLVFAVKKEAGEATAGHLIVEIDTEFISLWDSITIKLYE